MYAYKTDSALRDCVTVTVAFSGGSSEDAAAIAHWETRKQTRGCIRNHAIAAQGAGGRERRAHEAAGAGEGSQER
eukprot:3987901-Prymnesium_polylepis.1